MKHRLYGCARLETCDGRELDGGLRRRGAEAEVDDPFWTRPVPLGPNKPTRPEEEVMQWVAEEVIFEG